MQQVILALIKESDVRQFPIRVGDDVGCLSLFGARLRNRVCCIHELKRNRKLLSTAVVNVAFTRHIIWGGERRVPSCHACANAALLVCIINYVLKTPFWGAASNLVA